MRVATLNIWGANGDWTGRRALLRNGFAALEPDLIALQETIVTSQNDQVGEILADGYHIVHSRRRASDGMGVSIASRWPVANVEELTLQGSARDDAFPCTTLIVTTEAPHINSPIRFVNHFPSWKPQQELEREQQAVQAARRLEELDGHVIVTGDFDADAAAASLRFWTGHQSLAGLSVCYRDAWERVHPGAPIATFAPEENPLVADPDWPFGRIDHVLVRCSEHGGPTLSIRDCQRIFDNPPASDHYGILADLA